MQAIVFANRSGEELAPLHTHLCPALLPVANKPVIEHCLDELKLNHVDELFLVVDGEHLSAIRTQIETGRRWSLTVHYLISREGEHPDQIRRRLGRKLKTPYLALRADLLRGQQRWHSDDQPATVWVDSGGRSVGVQQVINEPCSLDAVHWPLQRPRTTLATKNASASEKFTALDSLAEYHRVALQAAEDALPVAPRGLKQGVALRVGVNSQIHHRSLSQGRALIGDYTQVHDEARLSGQTAIGNHCVIDRGAQVRNSLVLDHTYVGAGLTLENAIAYGNRMLRVDLQADLAVDEPFLLADCRSQPRSRLFERLIGLMLLLISLPLWLIAAGWAGVKNPTQPLIRHSADNLWQWNIPLALLARLPHLLALIRGELRLFGRAPGTLVGTATAHSDESTHTDERPWSQHYAKLPQGLFSPARWLLPDRASPEMIELTELEYHARGLFACLLARYRQH